MSLRVAVAVLASSPALASVQAYPAFTGYVVDQADLLSPGQERVLARALGAVERSTRHQFAVVTVRSLNGRNIEEYSTALGNHWGVGRRGLNDGVLLVVAPVERKVRIATGEGLKAELTDAEAQAIIARRMLPRFRAGRMDAGILSGSAQILREIAAEKV